jgi:hypothetical protein
MTGEAHEILERAGLLADRARSVADLEHHRLELIAARRLRERGQPVPEALVAVERAAAASELAAPALLRRVRDAADGPMVLVKGPSVAAHYPDPTLRDFRDLDLLVPDAGRTQRQLLAAGFQEAGDPRLYVDIHHLRPLHWPGLPLVVEVHHTPKWLHNVDPPEVSDLIGAAAGEPPHADGILVLPAAHHAILLAAHGWAHRPLSRIRDLLDVALVARAAELATIEELARSWGLGRMWSSTARVAGALLGGATPPLSMKVWARHLGNARERTVLESHLQQWFGDFCALPRDRLVAAAGALGADLVPRPGEGWGRKLVRTRAAVGDAFKPKSQHDTMLRREGRE